MKLTHGDIVETIEVGQSLNVIFVFNQFFCATMEETNVLKPSVNNSSTKSPLVDSLDQPVEFPRH